MSEAREVASPDGRRWTVTTGRSHRSFSAARREPYFWAHVVLTGIIVIVLILVLHTDQHGVLTIFIPIVFVIWLIGFLGASLRPTIRAETAGPPPDHREWTVEKRFHTDESLEDVAAAIARGEPGAEPSGTRLTAI